MFWAQKIQICMLFLLSASVCVLVGQAILMQPSPPTQPGPVFARQTDYDTATIEHVTLDVKRDQKSSQTIARRGIVYRYKDAVANVLICHGFMCDKFDVGFLRQMFPAGKFNLMTFDFRAHGENKEGQCCTFGRDEAYEVLAAADYLKNHAELKNKPLFVYGFSMGAVAAIEAQASRKGLFDAMVLDCPYDSSENIIKQGLSQLKFSLFGYEFALPGQGILQKYAFHPYVQSFVKVLLKTVAAMNTYHVPTQIHLVKPAESVKKILVPCFFIHCKNDEKIPVSAVKSVYQGASGYKSLWITNGRRHFDSFFYNPEKYGQRVRAFFENVLMNSLPPAANNQIMQDDEEIALNNATTQGKSDEI